MRRTDRSGRAGNTLRITGGVWRSRLIRFPDVPGLRPTADRVRETLFNWLGQDLTGLACLDLFAGSGALGFEAASRGAAAVTMVEKHRAAFAALQENSRQLAAENVRLERGDALEFLAREPARYDVIFVDPPFRQGLPEGMLGRLAERLAQGGRVYIESDQPFREETGWRVIRQARAGQVHYHLLERAVARNSSNSSQTSNPCKPIIELP
ncbi:MAG: 16S rRNA (guanine(966)-N(2))-methyltransferase RsmD [Betaproteobacteria bacterium RIFCSPLOWO2_02_FULL_65_24]|nr:MAG: 16S rRNA (guanine(966)-N(2))-methyltransferase RsmD [Betaproteobacteria bacterium RIFCSPLOWO2_02_FULL_65_24]OGA71611.1 MAG: 16S rRNA (guanine(966)-N(2))-methyltransferase RsmD [Betaproteobacteria bacterium RIFCSPLOWO2_12_FULL_66_14]